MKGDEEPASPPSPLREEELCVLQQRARQLEARRGRITSKKVYLKNKKVKTQLTRQGGTRRDESPWPPSRFFPKLNACAFFSRQPSSPLPPHLLVPGDLHRQSQPEDAAAAGRTRAGQLPADVAAGQTPQCNTQICRGGKSIRILYKYVCKNTLVKVLLYSTTYSKRFWIT